MHALHKVGEGRQGYIATQDEESYLHIGGVKTVPESDQRERFRVGQTVTGKVVQVIEKGLIVLLDEETTGMIPVSAALSFASMQDRFPLGSEVRVYISGPHVEEEHAFSLSLTSSDKAVAAFDREFDQLNHVLTNCTSRGKNPRVSIGETSVEERIEGWIDEVEGGLDRLRKHRGKRLSEEF